jgi:hypothetical protein
MANAVLSAPFPLAVNLLMRITATTAVLYFRAGNCSCNIQNDAAGLKNKLHNQASEPE